MPAFEATHILIYQGSNVVTNGMTLTRFSAGGSADPGTVTDGNNDIWTPNEAVTASPASSTTFIGDDGDYVGVFNFGGKDYPVILDFENGATQTVYKVLFESLSEADAFATANATIALDTTQNFTACFCEGTLISTPTGARAVETLTIGDKLQTASGGLATVTWLGRQTVSKLRHGAHMQPVRIRAGALGDGLPHSDLTITADHGMVLDGFVINAAALVNGDSIDFVPMAELEDSFTVYHIETEAHDVILANGAPSETFIDYLGRKAFDNYAEYLDLYGAERIIRENPMPRIAAARLLPQAIRDRLGIASDQTRKTAA